MHRGRDVGAQNVDRPAAPFQRLFGEQHRQRIDFPPGRATDRPDRSRLMLALRSASSGKACGRAGRTGPVAEEVGLVVEQRLDHRCDELRLAPHHQDGDQLVERGDARSRRSAASAVPDPPSAAHRQLLAGARLEQAGKDTAGAVAYLACAAPRSARLSCAAILSGGRRAQAIPASSDRRGMPQTAELASSWAMIEPPPATRRGGALDAVAAHAGQHDAERLLAEHGAGRTEHRVDRRAGTARRLRPEPAGPPASPSTTDHQMRFAGATMIASGNSRMPSSATTASRLAAAKAGARTRS